MTHSPFHKLVAEFLPLVGTVFNGALEHFSDAETVKPIWEVKGEILEVKPFGLCIDDGNGDETFVSFFTIAAHRNESKRDLDWVMEAPKKAVAKLQTV